MEWWPAAPPAREGFRRSPGEGGSDGETFNVQRQCLKFRANVEQRKAHPPNPQSANPKLRRAGFQELSDRARIGAGDVRPNPHVMHNNLPLRARVHDGRTHIVTTLT